MPANIEKRYNELLQASSIAQPELFGTYQTLTDFEVGSTFNGRFMMLLLGTFWHQYFDDKEELAAVYDSTGQVYFESYLKLLESVSTLSRFDIPVFHLENWHPLVLRQSEVTMRSVGDFTYGYGLFYNDKTLLQYGNPPAGNRFSVIAPDNLAKVKSITNRIVDPGVILSEGTGYTVADGRIYFVANPFTNKNFASKDILDEDGNIVDKEVLVWLHMSEWDLDYVYNHFGYVLGVWMRSSHFYKDFVNAMWESMVDGASKKSLVMALEALSGIKLAVGDETVLLIRYEANLLNVMTDKNLYTYPLASTVIVSEGDVLLPDQPIVDTVMFLNSNNGVQAHGLSLGKGFLTAADKPITFMNAEVSINHVGYLSDSRAVIQFDVTGDKRSVNNLFATLNGVNDYGEYLARYLDTRGNKIGVTKPVDLPQTINPAKFILDNFLKANVSILRIRPELFVTGAPGLSGMAHMRRHLAPQTALMIFSELAAIKDVYSNAEDSLQMSLGGMLNTDSTSSASDLATVRGVTTSSSATDTFVYGLAIEDDLEDLTVLSTEGGSIFELETVNGD